MPAPLRVASSGFGTAEEVVMIRTVLLLTAGATAAAFAVVDAV